MAAVPLPPLSAAGTKRVRSIVGPIHGTIDLSSLNSRQIDQLLDTLEEELPLVTNDTVRRGISEFAAELTRARPE